MGGAANPVDTTLGGPDDLLEGVTSEIGQLAALALEVAPQRLGRVELRGIAGQPLHHQPMALVGNDARILLLRWAASPSHSTVAFCPPRKRRSSPSTPIRLSVL